MKRRLKRSTKQHIVVSFLCIIIFGGVFLTAYLTVIINMKKNYETEINELSNQLETNKVKVYEAGKNIPAGSVITKDELMFKQVLSEQPQDDYITEKELGMVTLIDIKTGTPLLKSMLTKKLSDNSMREAEFNTIYLNSNLKENDYVDIRILYPNGENYIVLSKKQVKNLSLEKNDCFMWLNADELLRISGAIVDCFLKEGSKLYCVKYIEPRIQEASVITYIPNADVIRLIQKDPNVVQKAMEKLSLSVRSELESRLNQFYSNYGGEVTWDQYYTSQINPINQADNTEDLSDSDHINDTYQTGNDTKADTPDEYKQKEENKEEIYYVD
ncbi:hypothetical protein Ana3638_20575 [Anaerocolumna sedimenticola]|uniref:SAF domain-containing protein n=1 Tax=Anaerocolumna sedimenticola TaxID=2696063 RepID=A0A6P1TRJ4_9FIRM|nr:SAF domain-containing protein [Anaerocolumna sedimenticola]QHQ62879.1 hypothetical protein Ana3638_20575 [Anaerocolumna sedimenticola]